MNKELDANKKHYFKTVGQKELKSLMIDMIKESPIVKIWQRGKSDQNVEEYNAVKFNQENLSLLLSPRGGFLSRLTYSDLVDKEIFIRIGEGHFQLFFTSTLKKGTEKHYTLHFPSEVYVGQQRRNFRLRANQHNKIGLKIQNEVRKCLDISVGGTSFTIDPHELEIFKIGKLFENCILSFNGAQFHIPLAKIASVEEREQKFSIVHKIGVEFLNIENYIENQLFIHINSEVRTEEIRKKISQMQKNKHKK